MANISVSDIQEVYAEKPPSLDNTKKTALKDIAESFTEDLFGGRIARFSEIEGDENQFARYMGAHLWEISEGGEPNSQSQTGGSVNFQHLQSNVENSLGETRYGRICLLMLRQSTSSGIIRADR